MNQMLGNNSAHDDDDVSGSSDDSYSDGETDSDEDEHEENVKTSPNRKELEWDDSTMNF